MLKLYAVKVWRTSEPRNCEDVEVRTYTPPSARPRSSGSGPPITFCPTMMSGISRI